jgi:hypothetical protein
MACFKAPGTRPIIRLPSGQTSQVNRHFCHTNFLGVSYPAVRTRIRTCFG